MAARTSTARQFKLTIIDETKYFLLTYKNYETFTKN